MSEADATTAEPRATLRLAELGPLHAGDDAKADAPEIGVLARRYGRADEGCLRSELARARSRGDARAERDACVDLAKFLANGELSLAEAAGLAERALAVSDDGELREGAAGWFEGCGLHAEAARLLLRGAVAGVDVSLRAAVAFVRAGDAEAARAVLVRSADADDADAASLELLASIAGWAPLVVSAGAAAAAYLQAASRRRAAGRPDAELENRQRALEIDRGNVTAAFALAATWAERGRSGAVASVRRAFDGELDPAASRALHALVVSASPDDVGEVLASALDARLDCSQGDDDAIDFDELLTRSGLDELRTARREILEPAAAARARGTDEAAGSAEPGREPARAWARAARDGDDDARAAALEAAAEFVSAPVRAALLAVAADVRAQLGHADRARLDATLAMRAAPQSMRAAASVRAAFRNSRDLTEVVAMEQGAHHGGVLGAECAELSAALTTVGGFAEALPWAQRAVTLRPGDPRALAALIARAVAVGDATRLCDVLCWVISQALPLTMLAPPLAFGVAALADVDASRAAVVVRRAIDAFGCGDEPLADALIMAARSARDRGLEALVHQRRVDAAQTQQQRCEALMAIARLRAELGDHDGELRALRAARDAGLAISLVAERLPSLVGRAQSADAELAWLTLHAEALEAELPVSAQQHPRRRIAGPEAERVASAGLAAAAALREVGAALWDCTGDRAGALSVWTRAAVLAGEGAMPRLARDVERFAPAGHALETLCELAAASRHAQVAAELEARAASLALAAGDAGRAFDLASSALSRDASVTSALRVAEKGAMGARTPARMSRLYAALSDASLGRFGRRAAHFRGARFFEQCGEPALALKHAASAFEAVPSEGAPLVVLRRAAANAGDDAAAVAVLVAVADSAPSKAARTAWLLRAADAAGGGEVGLRTRFDLLMKAALAARSPLVVSLFADATRALLSSVPAEREALRARVTDAAGAIMGKLEGPDGARIGLDFARLSLEAFGDASGALAAIEAALEADADLEEYGQLFNASKLLGDSDAAPKSISGLAAMLARPYANVGAAALRLFAAIARARGDVAMVGTFVLLGAERDPDDDELVREADAIARGLGDAPAALRFFKSVKQGRRLEAWAAAVESAVARGDRAASVAALERVVELSPENDKPVASDALRAARASDETPRGIGEDPGPASADDWAALAQTDAARGDHPAAIRALTQAARLDAGSVERWSALERVATLANDHAIAAVSLGEIELRSSGVALPDVLRRLAAARAFAGDRASAIATWIRVLELVPDDDEADRALEALHAEGRAFAELARHLQRRADRLANHAEHRDTVRLVRLRRAAILEQRLGLIEQACDEVERIAIEWPNNESVLRYLADLCERADRPARAVACYRRLAGVAVSDSAKATFLLRAARAARAARDVVTAHGLAQSATLAPDTRREAFELIAEIARERHDDRSLARALSFLADAESLEPGRAGALLLEASQAAVRAGDGASALNHALRAAKLTPFDASAQLFARGLEYRMRGSGTVADARATIAELAGIEGALGRDDAALKAFLCSEAIAVVSGADAAIEALALASRDLGPHALLEAAAADHHANASRLEQARDAYAVALDGPLLGMRARSVVAQSAAAIAVEQGDFARALSLLEMAAEDPALRERARRRIADLCERTGDVNRARRLVGELDRAGASVASPRPPPIASVVAEVAAPNSVEGWLTLSRRARENGDSESVARLFASCDAGARVEIGDDLAALLGGDSAAASTLLGIRQIQVDARPGDVRLLKELGAAATAAGATSRARAAEQIVAACDASVSAPAPPSLQWQVVRADTAAMLVRPGVDPVCDALALVWEAAKPAFARMLAGSSEPNLQRVAPGSDTAVARAYRDALRLLGVDVLLLAASSTSLASGAPAGGSAPRSARGEPLLAQLPSALVSGDLESDGPSLNYAVGYGIVAALPRSVLILGSHETDARLAWNSILAAFGPGDMRRTLEDTDTRMVEALWNAVPSRAQRRLRDVLASEVTSFAAVRERARQIARRGGLFLSGDFALSLHALAADVDLAGDDLVSGRLDELCARSPAVADLVRLAASEPYAVARFQSDPNEGG